MAFNLFLKTFFFPLFGLVFLNLAYTYTDTFSLLFEREDLNWREVCFAAYPFSESNKMEESPCFSLLG